MSVHVGECPAAKPAVAAPRPPVDEAAIRRRATGEALAGISLFAFRKRVEAKERARVVAEDRISQARDAREQEQAEEQARLDEEWRLLLANDPATVLEELEASFDDNEAPAVPIDCAGDAVSIVMLYPTADQIPEQKAALTPTGRPTVHKRSKTERHALHVRGMASHILATVRETFAVAPAINRVVVLTVEKDDAVGGIPMLRAVAATGFDRQQVDQFRWDKLDALATVEAANPSLIDRRGRTGELAPLDLSDEPQIATVLVTCAAMLDVQVDPRANVPPGTRPHLPYTDEAPPHAHSPVAAPAIPIAAPPTPEAAASAPQDAWSRFRGTPWWTQVVAWLLVSPVIASWWCWRRAWPVWGRLVAIGVIVLASLTVAGSFDSSNASKKTAAPPAPATTTSGSTAPTTTGTTAQSPGKRTQKPRIQAGSAGDVFNPIEKDGYRDTVRVYFRTPTADTDSVRVMNARGKVVRTAELGRLSANHVHTWRWDGRTSQGRLAAPGAYDIRVVARHDGHVTASPAVTVNLRPLAPRISDVGVSPSPFYPIEQDGYLDTTTVTFRTNTDDRVTIRVRSSHGRIIRAVALGSLPAHTQQSWSWDGRDNAGQAASPGAYQLQVGAVYYGLRADSAWRTVRVKRKATAPSNCTPGYSPCLVYHGGADYDCYGGSGNGPYYTAPGQIYAVTGSDPYGLDANNNGLGCE